MTGCFIMLSMAFFTREVRATGQRSLGVFGFFVSGIGITVFPQLGDGVAVNGLSKESPEHTT